MIPLIVSFLTIGGFVAIAFYQKIDLARGFAVNQDTAPQEIVDTTVPQNEKMSREEFSSYIDKLNAEAAKQRRKVAAMPRPPTPTPTPTPLQPKLEIEPKKKIVVPGPSYSEGAYYTQGKYYSEGAYVPSYAQAAYKPTYSQSSYTPTYAESSYVPTYAEGSYAPTYAEGSYVVQGQFRDGTYPGTAIPSLYGDIQVSAIIAGGKLVDVQILKAPDDGGNSTQVNTRALPILRTEAIAAQSAIINSVTGATEASLSYRQSLQAALTAAKA